MQAYTGVQENTRCIPEGLYNVYAIRKFVYYRLSKLQRVKPVSIQSTRMFRKAATRLAFRRQFLRED